MSIYPLYYPYYPYYRYSFSHPVSHLPSKSKVLSGDQDLLLTLQHQGLLPKPLLEDQELRLRLPLNLPSEGPGLKLKSPLKLP